MPGLGASFGRGAATTYQQDLANSDCLLFMGSNMAEAHPVGFRWPMKAKERGATLIHVDPRFSRTSAHCDLFVGIRTGSDIAFLGGLINYVLTHERWFEEYVLAYTNASVLIEQGYKDTEDLDWAMDQIALRVKAARDADFTATDSEGRRLNSVRNIGTLGGATLDVEENYLIKKLFTAGLGVVSVENQARI